MFGICFLFGGRGGRVGSVPVGCVDGRITNPSDMRGSKEKTSTGEGGVHICITLPFFSKRETS